MVAVMFVVLWRADWNMVGHWNLLVDWEFHFFVDDVGSVDWDLDFILWVEKKCNQIWVSGGSGEFGGKVVGMVKIRLSQNFSRK